MTAPTATLTYKTSPIPLDYDLFSPSTTHFKAGPCILWYHIGSLYYGDKKTCIPEWLIKGCQERGWTLISASYRLLPEATIDDTMQDVKDMWTYIHSDLNSELERRSLTLVDTKKVFLAGGSAGGYLTLQGGHMLSPKPTALVSMYGYTFTNDDWFARPQEGNTLVMGDRLDATEQFEQGILSYFQPGKPQVGGRPFDTSRAESNFYSYQIWKGTYFKNTFGIGSSLSLPSHPELHHLFPQYALVDGASYPPVLLIHGKEDSPIPYTESVNFSNWLEERGYEHELVILEGQEHVWDLEDNEIAEGGRRKVWEFLDVRA